ncbi:hypothetical protein M2283_009901 [Streptomyces pseudovenezuelae]|uniref:Uncharacterized protein n=1 Tax=Streptomyces pseudovenezuelae TaxID=67350 RepID=A0ABT6M349_9ACTN|nr:hypothetical protein [Streptomyces pseudovenezuelae]
MLPVPRNRQGHGASCCERCCGIDSTADSCDSQALCVLERLRWSGRPIRGATVCITGAEGGTCARRPGSDIRMAHDHAVEQVHSRQHAPRDSPFRGHRPKLPGLDPRAGDVFTSRHVIDPHTADSSLRRSACVEPIRPLPPVLRTTRDVRRRYRRLVAEPAKSRLPGKGRGVSRTLVTGYQGPRLGRHPTKPIGRTATTRHYRRRRLPQPGRRNRRSRSSDNKCGGVGVDVVAGCRSRWSMRRSLARAR